MEKGQKPEPGKKNDQRKLRLSIKVLRETISCIISPYEKFGENDNFSPSTLKVCHKWSFERFFVENGNKGPPTIEEIQHKPLNLLWKNGSLGPLSIQILHLWSLLLTKLLKSPKLLILLS